MKHVIIAGPGRSGKTNISLKLKKFTHYKMDSIKRGLDNNFYDNCIPYYKVSPKMAHLIKVMIEEVETDTISGKEYYVIDTCHLYPRDIIDQKIDNTLIIFIGYPNISPYEKLECIRKYDKSNIWTNNLTDKQLLEYIEEGILYSKELEKECLKYGVPFFDISFNYNEKIREIISFVNRNLK